MSATPATSVRRFEDAPDEVLATELLRDPPLPTAVIEAYRRFLPRMTVAARRELQGQPLAPAADFAHDTLTRALVDHRLRSLRDPARIRAFLDTAVRNAVNDAIRKQRRRERAATTLVALRSDAPAPAQPDAVVLAVRNALDSLSPADREILQMRLDGRKLREIAAGTHLSYSATAQRLSRAIRKLRRLLVKSG